jgi:glyoxylase-like metal-dependent hydrolase (beta-lactamase superfamily II)
MLGTADAWVMVDTALPGNARRIAGAAARRFGSTPPKAIVLTHGHYDHSGSALALANLWQAPIYAHPEELPYLSGKTYPPPSLAAGGMMAALARIAPGRSFDLGGRVLALPPDGSVPEIREWRWLHTPGHTPGHISIFRERDRSLIAGDSLATMNLDTLGGLVFQRPGLFRPPAPFTMDWDAARASVARLAEFRPSYIGAGHGPPLEHSKLRQIDLMEFQKVREKSLNCMANG